MFKINKMYLVKKPYTDWAGKDATPVNSTDTYNFTNGLEQRYGVEAIGTGENNLFQKIKQYRKQRRSVILPSNR